MWKTLLKVAASKTATFIFLTVLILFGLSLNLGLSQADNLSIASTSDCNVNAVIYCGVSSVDALINKYSNGDSVNTAASIAHIYSFFGITSDSIHDMNGGNSNEVVTTGSVTKAGNIYDSSGKLVAKDAVTAGRVEGQDTASNQVEMVNGTKFYVRKPSTSFNVSTLSAYIVTINNKFAFAVLASCGNPVMATPIVPPAPKPKPVQPSTVKPTSTTTTLNYCSGNTTNTNSGIASQGGNCSSNTTVVQTPPPPTSTPSPTPFGQCTSLSLSVIQSSPLEVSVTANPTTGNGANLEDVSFNFGDGVTTPPSSQTTANHTYANPGNYTIIATLAFTATGQSVPNATCQATLTQAAPPPVVTTTSVITKPAAQTAPLVNTGPGNVIALFGATSLISMIGYRIFLSRRM